jgi:hypothetical protein
VSHNADAEFAFDAADHAAEPACAQVDEAMAGLAVKPVPMGRRPGCVVALDAVLRAVEHEGLGHA